jgi:hydroxymethylglutaryl-CoA synthase
LIGVTGCSIYIPRYRIRRATITAAWNAAPAPGCKAVSNFDEDTVTMAQAAAWPLVDERTAPDRIHFASTAAPYWQRASSSQIAAICDLPASTATVDFSGALRVGLSALLAAADALEARSAQTALVVAADHRDGAPESSDELTFGDAAAAIALGSQDVSAEIIGRASRSDDFLDEWRRDSDRYIRSYASRYSTSRGYEANMLAVIQDALESAGVSAGGIAHAALASPDGRSHNALAKGLGLAPSRIMDTRATDLGVTGVAMPLLLLAQALQAAQPGDLILCAAYGDGADAILLRVLRAADPLQTDARVIEYSSYPLYRKSRDYLRESSGGAEISNVLWKKEERQNVRLHGSRCPICGTVQFPITRVCGACRNSEGLIEQRLGRTGSVFTFTKDFLYDAPAQPTVMAVIDLDGGGRFLCQMTDADEREVRIGMPVELVFRRARESSQNHNYYWKCRPV